LCGIRGHDGTNREEAQKKIRQSKKDNEEEYDMHPFLFYPTFVKDAG
jgi:hypothetical protein